MNSFQVLDRDTNINRHFLLEASAGTGKTFSIENIVSRLLIEQHGDELPPTIDKILVVTFTRAATLDLKTRIRANLEKALKHLTNALKGFALESLPDYLSAVIENGEPAIRSAKQRIEHALFCFTDAQIFTIHGFCSKMLRDFPLEADVGADLGLMQDSITKHDLINIIHDYFRTGITREKYSPAQLEIAIKGSQNNKKFERDILKEIEKNLPVSNSEDFSTLFERFRSAMSKLKSSRKLSSDKLIADFTLQAPNYKGINLDTEKMIGNFALLFDRDEWTIEDFDMLIRDGLVWVDKLNPDNQKKRTKLISPQDPEFTEALRKDLFPIINVARNRSAIFSRLVHDAKILVSHYLEQEEKFNYNDLIRLMEKGLKNPDFLQKVRNRFSAAIIDEFQDTDPAQWKIFHTLFLEGNVFKGNLYLVGDPKQSIYAFRQADIYTYLAAADAIGPQGRYSLDTNYRSQPSLVSALNTLFTSENAQGLISLPKLERALDYQIVNASAKIQNRIFNDDRESIHFMIAEATKNGQHFPDKALEKNYYFPFLTEEILRLHEKDNVPFNEFAILVRDWYQAARLSDFLKEWKIPFITQRSASLADSPARDATVEILQGILNPRDNSAFNIALGGLLIGYTNDHFLSMNEEEKERLLLQFFSLREKLLNNGFSLFFRELLQSKWKNDQKTLEEIVLERQDGEDFLDDLKQIADLLIDHQNKTHSSPEGLILYLDKFDILQLNEDDDLKSLQDPQKEGVIIQTLHGSKGLEYGIVFALGLFNRTKDKDILVPVDNDGVLQLAPVIDKKSESNIKHYQENDAEKIRQLYVAMTRAKYRLYVPVAQIIQEKTGPNPGTASPMELFLAHFAQPYIEHSSLYERITGYNEKILCDFIDQFGEQKHLSYSRLNNVIFNLHPYKRENSLQLTPPPELSLSFVQTYIRSFTSISSLVSQPLESNEIPIDPYRLPVGAETGIQIHHLFEILPYSAVRSMTSSDELLPFIEPELAGTSLAAWSQQAASIIFKTLKTPLKNLSGSFCLCSIPAERMTREIEFLYPYNGHLLIEELYLTTEFIQGIIDLVCLHEGKYYLVDWKTNWLGDSTTDYNQANMQKAMKDNSYFLQASIYTEALKRYLKTIDPRPFNDIFGGVYYLFVRGIDGHGNGILYFNPTEGLI